MKSALMIALLGTSLLGVPMLTGCDDKTSTDTTKKVEHPNGSTTVEKSKTSTDDNGNKSVDKSKTTTDANGNVVSHKEEQKAP